MYYYIALSVIGLMLIWVVGSYLVIRNIEEPKYTVLEKRDGFEIREYDAYIVAETTVTGNQEVAIREGFGIIADYIFGNNTTQSKIAMTAPVLEENQTSEKIAMTTPVLDTETSSTTRKIAFILPSAYTLDTLPLPNNDRVVIREVAKEKVAVLRYSWYSSNARTEEKKQVLSTLLAAADLKTIGEFRSAFYNPPLSMPLMLRNEIMVQIQ